MKEVPFELYQPTPMQREIEAIVSNGLSNVSPFPYFPLDKSSRRNYDLMDDVKYRLAQMEIFTSSDKARVEEARNVCGRLQRNEDLRAGKGILTGGVKFNPPYFIRRCVA